jgi:hypothetical protein
VILAQGVAPGGGPSTSVDVLIWVGALIVAVLLLGIVILLLRKRLFVKDGEDATGMLDQLRAMHKRGEMSTEEYDAARKALTARVAARLPDAKPVQRRAAPPPADQLRAKPGFDLTGAPLPRAAPEPGPYDRKPRDP